MELPLVMSVVMFVGSIALLAYVAYKLREVARSRRGGMELREETIVAVAMAEGKSSHPISHVSILGLDSSRFQHRTDVIDESLSIYAEMAVFNVVTGDITVQAGGALLLYAICAGNVVVNPRGSAAIYGTVVGSITNNGGELHIFGKVIGGVVGSSGETTVHST